MTLNRLVVPAIAIFLGVAGPGIAKASGLPQAQSASSYGQDRDAWDTPPQDLQEIQRLGFRDGIVGARKDFDNHRRPDVNDRAEYRHPNIPPELRQEYLAAFRRGYDHFMSEQAGGPPDPH